MPKAGQPTKFNEKMQGQIKVVALKGFTDVEIAAAVGVTERTINNWKKAHPKFFQSLKNWKDESDEPVEKSLRDRALGYNFTEVTEKPILIKDEAGVITGTEMAISKKVHKQVIPDTTAQIFWLKNRKKEEWADQTDVKITDESTINTSEETARRIAFLLRNKEEESK